MFTEQIGTAAGTCTYRLIANFRIINQSWENQNRCTYSSAQFADDHRLPNNKYFLALSRMCYSFVV